MSCAAILVYPHRQCSILIITIAYGKYHDQFGDRLIYSDYARYIY